MKETELYLSRHSCTAKQGTNYLCHTRPSVDVTCRASPECHSLVEKVEDTPVGDRGLLLLTPADGNLQGSLSPQLQTNSMYTKDTILPELYLYSRIFVHGLTVGSYVPHSRKSFRIDFRASAQPHQPFVFPKKGCTKKSY